MADVCILCAGPFTDKRRPIPLSGWDVEVCESCREWNWDGVVPGTPMGTRLIRHLQERGIEPRLNANGWIEWPNPN
jgi:hypothetical protein